MEVKFGFFIQVLTGLQLYPENFREAQIIKWLVKIGDHVQVGDGLCEVDTDKATGELPSIFSGVITRLNFDEGEKWEGSIMHVEETPSGTLMLPELGMIEIKEDVPVTGGDEEEHFVSPPIETSLSKDNVPKKDNKKPLITALARKKMEEANLSFEDILKKYPDKHRVEAQDVDLYLAELRIRQRVYEKIREIHNEEIIPIIPRFPEETSAIIAEDKKTQEKPIAVLPAARRRAKELGVDLADIRGSGDDGVITLCDVEEANHIKKPQVLEKPPMSWPTHSDLSNAERIEPASMTRKTIAALLQLSQLTIVHAGDEITIDLTDLKNKRDQIKEMWKNTNNTELKYDHFIMYFVAQHLREKEFAVLNAYWDWGAPMMVVLEAILTGDHSRLNPKIMYVPHVNLGIAVQTNEGLVVPVVHEAEKMGFIEFVCAANMQVEKARERKCTPADFRNLSVTVNRVAFSDEISGELIGGERPEAIIPCTVGMTGMLRSTSFILAFGKIQKVNARDLLKVVFRFDHRITDGAIPLRFVHKLRQFLEKECVEQFAEITAR